MFNNLFAINVACGV